MKELNTDKHGNLAIFCKCHLEEGRKLLKDKGLDSIKYGTPDLQILEDESSDSIEEVDGAKCKNK